MRRVNLPIFLCYLYCLRLFILVVGVGYIGEYEYLTIIDLELQRGWHLRGELRIRKQVEKNQSQRLPEKGKQGRERRDHWDDFAGEKASDRVLDSEIIEGKQDQEARKSGPRGVDNTETEPPSKKFYPLLFLILKQCLTI